MTVHTILVCWPIASVVAGIWVGRSIAAADLRDAENVKFVGLIHKDGR